MNAHAEFDFLAVDSGQRAISATAPLVLVVDDHLINRLVVQRQLNVLGYRTDAAEHGEAALQALEMLDYAMVITDCDMPVMDGYTLTRALRERERRLGLRRRPVIAFTASDTAGDYASCTAAGMDDRLDKPTPLDALERLMRRWLPLGEVRPTRDVGAATSSPATPSREVVPGQAGLPINPSVLRRLTGDDAAASLRALRHFWRVNAVDVAALVQAVSTFDFAATVREAHRIKGSSRLVGAERLAAVCAEIEIAGQQQDAAALLRLTPRFESEVRSLDDYLATAVA